MYKNNKRKKMLKYHNYSYLSVCFCLVKSYISDCEITSDLFLKLTLNLFIMAIVKRSRIYFYGRVYFSHDGWISVKYVGWLSNNVK